MKYILTLTIVFTSHGTLNAQDTARRLDSLANYYRETFDFNGAVLVAKKGNVLLSKGYGYQNKALNILNNSDGIYLIGSVTKQFTAELILMLASEGKLSLADKLSKYYPDYSPGDSVTLHHMLTHTSGIYDYTRDSAWQSKIDTPISNERLFSLFRKKPLQFSPGSKWSYCNTNYLLLGLIIQKVTGKSYYKNVRERIFYPLGMTHSGFDFTHLQDKNKTVGYYKVRNDSFLVSIIVDSTHTNSAGAIYSNTADMLKWHEALQSYKLLTKEWQNKAFTPFKNGYGYGWEIDTVSAKLVLSHSGHIHGYNSNFYRLPDEDVCIVVFTNLMKTGADPIIFARDIVQAMYDPAYTIPEICKEIQLSENIKKRYEGIYNLVDDTSLFFTFKVKNKQLCLTVTGQPEIVLLPKSERIFFTKVVDARIEFKQNKKGYYDMVLHQYGQKLEGHKHRN